MSKKIVENKKKKLTNSINNELQISSDINNKSTTENINTEGNKLICEKDYINKYNFFTKSSNDIKIILLKKAEGLIDRKNAIKKLEKYIEESLACEIEKGIFEFSLINVVIHKFQDNFVSNIYFDKLEDICKNLDLTNISIGNTILIETVRSKDFNPKIVAFLSPEQLHPKRWSDIMEKQKIREDVINNISTTDSYKCKKCGESKTKVSRLQLRSADEPENLFIVCLVCYHTTIK
jgi:DNA-directed RNA polymerase subunit M/transcription elongation factor TFIIS